MLYSQYLRLETIAGGVGCTDKQFIAACHTFLKNKFSREEREHRHAWIRDGLAYLNKSRNMYIKGRF
jgi:hypothetical protein